MANASGVDFLSPWATEGADVAAASFGGFTYSSIGRYTNITNAEIDNIHSHGLSIWFISENTGGLGPQGALGYTPRSPGYFTYAQGAFDGPHASGVFTGKSSSTFGAVPANCMIYFTVDFDASSAAINGIISYFQGLVDSIGVSRIGAYGSGYVVNTLGANGLISNGWQSESSGWRQNSTLGPYTALWQKFVSGANVNGHAIDNDLMYVSDWGQWPSPSGTVTGSGGTNIAVVKGGTNSATQSVISTNAQTSTHSLITPHETQDLVVYSSTTSTTLVNGTTSNFYSLDSGIGTLGYPVGIFSSDNGATWSDLGFSNTISSASGIVAPPIQVVPKVDAGGTITFDGVNTTGSTATLLISIALLNAFNATFVPNKAHQVSQDKSYTNIYQTQNQFQPPYSTYRRIALDNVVLSSSGIPHGLSDIPTVAAWTFTGSAITIGLNAWSSAGVLLGNMAVRVDNTDINVDFSGGVTAVYYRLYKDNT